MYFFLPASTPVAVTVKCRLGVDDQDPHRSLRTMIERCLQAEPGTPGREFGILWLSEQELKPVGCACDVERVVERMDDGRLNLVARGTRPFRVLERLGHLAYPAGVIEFVHDLGDEVDPSLEQSARDAYTELVKRATDREPDAAELAEMDAYAMAATVDFGLDAKQGLLDLRSENARLGLVTRLFRAALKRLDFVDRAQARARSNGKVRFG